MSILIKGMEMPKTEEESRLLILTPDGVTWLTQFGLGNQKFDTIEVPPHGRLIDADALDDAFTELRWDSEGLAHWGDRNEWCLSGNEVEELFNNAPTVIPADKDGET